MTPDAYRSLLDRLDRWFAEGRRAAGGLVPCRDGCSACCHGPFDISVADAELIGEAVDGLPDDVRSGVIRRAEALLEKMRALEPGWTPPYAVDSLGEERFDRLTEALAAEPCPLLDDAGRCRIYADRPLVCRMIGLGMRTPAGRVIENACPIQDRFPGYAALAPVPFELEAFEDVEAECLRGAAERRFGDAERHGFETTIAGAIVERGAGIPGGAGVPSDSVIPSAARDLAGPSSNPG
jgi:Fe-S-cluster containining protein